MFLRTLWLDELHGCSHTKPTADSQTTATDTDFAHAFADHTVLDHGGVVILLRGFIVEVVPMLLGQRLFFHDLGGISHCLVHKLYEAMFDVIQCFQRHEQQ